MQGQVHSLAGFLWSAPLVMLCIGAGLFFSLATRFVQVRYFREMLAQMLGKASDSKAGISSFQSLMLGLSGRLGTGNIAGIATAIAMGGPGAIFWMWVIAFLGAGSAFAESTLGQLYKTKEQGEYRGGPAYYIEKGLGLRWYAVLFSCAILTSYIVFLPGVQANAITVALDEAFGLPPVVVGLGIIVSLAILLRTGVQGFAKFSQVVIPFMTLGYLVVVWVIIGLNVREVPGALRLIVASALGAEQVFAGIVGTAMSYGVRRGVFSTEAGLGTQVSAAAAAETKHPVSQGLVQAFSIYIDTFLVSTSTAVMLLVTGAYNVLRGANGTEGYLVEQLPGVNHAGPGFTIEAVEGVFAGWGSGLIAVAIFFFAYTTFVTYYYVAQTNLVYVFRGRKVRWLHHLMEVLFLFFIFRGSVLPSEGAWAMADIGVGLSAWINLVAILLLWRPLMGCFRDYEAQLRAGRSPVFVADKAGIKGTDWWRAH